MPEYSYKSKDGTVVDRYYPGTGHAPDKVWISGKRYNRFYTVPQVLAKETVSHVVSRSLPKGWKYADDFDKKGRPRFEGRKQIREAIAKANDHDEKVIYDY